MKVDLSCVKHPKYKAVRQSTRCGACRILFNLRKFGRGEISLEGLYAEIQ